METIALLVVHAARCTPLDTRFTVDDGQGTQNIGIGIATRVGLHAVVSSSDEACGML